MWIAEKFQTKSEIAGSPRNSFRVSLGKKIVGGRALNGARWRELLQAYQTPNTNKLFTGSQTARDKFRCQKGNSPDPQLRTQNVS